MTPRRSCLLTVLLLAPVAFGGCAASAGQTATAAMSTASSPSATQAAFTRLERRAGARVGVVALDTGSDRVVVHRADERFAFASTSKVLAAGVALRKMSDAELHRTVSFDASDVLEYAPVTDDFVGSGLAVRHLMNASLQWSDNTAANLVVEQLGGTARLERELRAFGDQTTSVDRTEPDLNDAVPGDTRDTTTPRTMALDLRRLLLGDALKPDRRQLLRSMMLANTTGDALVRAGVPEGWSVADKSGTAAYGTRNDVAVAWPPSGKPLVLVVYTTHARPQAKPDDALVAQATRVAIAGLR